MFTLKLSVGWFHRSIKQEKRAELSVFVIQAEAEIVIVNSYLELKYFATEDTIPLK